MARSPEREAEVLHGMETRGRSRRWAALAALILLLEFLWLMGRYTTATLPQSDQTWSLWMHRAKFLPQIGLAVVTMLLLFRGIDRAPAKPRADVAPGGRTAASRLAMLAAQLAAFALLAWTTAIVFEGHLEQARHPFAWIAAWLCAAALASLLGVLLFLPLSELLCALARRRNVIVGGAFLGLFAWWAGQYAANELSLPLRTPTLWLAGKLIRLLQPDIIIDTPKFEIASADYDFWVSIAPECSGFEGMGLMAVAAIGYVFVFRRRLRFPQALLLPILGVIGMWFLNVLRIFLLVMIGVRGSKEIAFGGFHTLAGTFAFCLGMLGLVLLATRAGFFSTPGERAASLEERDGTAAYLAPFLFVIAIGMVASSFREAEEWLQVVKLVLPAALLWHFRGNYTIDARASWVSGLAFGALSFVLWIAIVPFLAPAGVAGAASAAWSAAQIAGNVLVVPIVEELAFRGFLMRRLSAVHFEEIEGRQASIFAWVLSSVLFGVLHGHWIAATAAGALFGYAYMRRGRLFDAVLAHAVANALLVAYAALRGDWSLA
ncbi:MAG: exosortase E/protease, VPEID-CTERM system [Planctomycetes bacterium]|nr:exosortase E/protease, VPEID-CTERM system [Planctomycetota bacterium]